MKIRLGQLRKLLREAIEEDWKEVKSDPQRNRVDLIIERIINELDPICKKWWQNLSARIARNEIHFPIRPNMLQLQYNNEIAVSRNKLYTECSDQIYAILESEDIVPDTIFSKEFPTNRIVDAVANEYWVNIASTITDADSYSRQGTSNMPSGRGSLTDIPHIWNTLARRIVANFPDLDTTGSINQSQATISGLTDEIRLWCKDIVEQIVTSSISSGDAGTPLQNDLLPQFLSRFLSQDVDRTKIQEEFADIGFDGLERYDLPLPAICVIQTAIVMFKDGEIPSWVKRPRNERRLGVKVPTDWIYMMYITKRQTLLRMSVGGAGERDEVQGRLEKNLELLANVTSRYLREE